IHELRGEAAPERVDTEMKIPVTALIPDDYVKDENLRLHYYKTLFSAADEAELTALKQEMTDRFGGAPELLVRLWKVARLKQQLRDCGARRLQAVGRGSFEIHFGALAEDRIDRVLGIIGRHPDRYRLAPGGRLRLTLPELPGLEVGGQDQ